MNEVLEEDGLEEDNDHIEGKGNLKEWIREILNGNRRWI